MRKLILSAAIVMASAVPFATAASAAPPAHSNGEPAVTFGALYHDDEIVRTVVLPAASPNEGRDALYAFPGMEQMAVASVAPGDAGYHGGQWAVHTVSWNTTPRPLTSEDAIQAAASAGDVTITRAPAADFKCPIQP